MLLDVNFNIDPFFFAILLGYVSTVCSLCDYVGIPAWLRHTLVTAQSPNGSSLQRGIPSCLSTSGSGGATLLLILHCSATVQLVLRLDSQASSLGRVHRLRLRVFGACSPHGDHSRHRFLTKLRLSTDPRAWDSQLAP